jgi:acetylornithine deacetylase/succinyl-diaminopimelate desuccinylase family protein
MYSFEHEAVDKIDSHQDDIIELCSRMVQISSENPPGDTTELASFLCKYLESKGLEYEVYAPQKTMPNVVCRLRGSGPGRRLIYNGHLDTYPSGDSERWQYDPLSGLVADGKIYGRGVSDMKGGCTASIASYWVLSQLRDRFKGEVVLTLVSDEETGGRWGTKWLLDNVPWVQGDAMLNGEPTSLSHLTFSEKGRLILEFVAKGVGAHGAYVHMGENAIVRMIEFLNDLQGVAEMDFTLPVDVERVLEEGRQALDEAKGTGTADVIKKITCNIGTIQGGIIVNTVPESCRAEVDIRLPTGARVKDMLQQVNKRVARHRGISYRVAQGGTDPTFTPPDHEICLLLVQCAEKVWGHEVMRLPGLGASDARLFRDCGVPSVLYGPKSHGMGGTDEYITIEDLMVVTKAHALTSLAFLQR